MHYANMLNIIAILLSCKYAACQPAEPSFYSASSISHDRILYDYPRPPPKRRGDVPPRRKEEPIEPLRYINYGKDGHPYEQVDRLRQRHRSLTEDENGYHENKISRILQNTQLYQPLRIHFDTVRLMFDDKS